MTVGQAGELLLRDAILSTGLSATPPPPREAEPKHSPCLARPAHDKSVLGFGPPSQHSFLRGNGVVLSGWRGAGRKRILGPGIEVASASCPGSNYDCNPQNGGLSARLRGKGLLLALKS